MGNPKSIYNFSYHNFSDALYWLTGKRILYNIPTGEKYFYSKMTIHMHIYKKFKLLYYLFC